MLCAQSADMFQRLSSFALPLAILGVGIFIWVSKAYLPGTIASHFDSLGRPNSFVTRDVYVYFMIGMSVGLPSIVGFVPGLAIRARGARINLPNGDYWLAPGRRGETIDFVADRMRVIGIMVALFMAYAHWLVIEANTRSPPSLPATQFYYGMVVFVVGTGIWMLTFFRHFRRPS